MPQQELGEQDLSLGTLVCTKAGQGAAAVFWRPNEGGGVEVVH